MDVKLDKIVLKLEMVDTFRSLKRGDHLAVRGKYKAMKYHHHGIYLEHDAEVADFGTDSNKIRDARVRKIDIFEFKGDGPLFKFTYPEGTCQDPETAAHLAEEVVNMPEIWGPYHILKNNCEHFATRCKTGKPYSIQVERILEKTKKAAAKSATSAALCSVL